MATSGDAPAPVPTAPHRDPNGDVPTGGGVFASGCGHGFRLGVAKRSEQNRHDFTEVPSFRGLTVRGVYAGGDHSMVLCADGLYVFGSSEQGQLGTGHREIVRQPEIAKGWGSEKADRIVDISLGGQHSMLLEESGRVWVCGANADGQLGNGGDGFEKNWIELETLVGTRFISAGLRHSVACVGNDVLCWGLGDNGQLGFVGDAWDTSTAKAERVRAKALHEATQRKREGVVGTEQPEYRSEVGEYNALLHPDNAKSKMQKSTVGDNAFFDPFCQRTPQKVPFEFHGVAAVAAGSNHTCVLTEDGLFAFGAQLGATRERISDLTPTRVTPPSPELSPRHLLALDGMRVLLCAAETGSLSVWVRGEGLRNGELGLGTDSSGDVIEDADDWKRILSDLPADTVARGAGNSVSLHSNSSGVLHTFGDNFYGQLGHGHDRPSPCPVAVKLPGRPGTGTAVVAMATHHALCFRLPTTSSAHPPAAAPPKVPQAV